MTEFRTERDSMGEVRLPAEAYYGPQTQRAVENFPISGRTLPPELIHALGLVKWAAAAVNRDLNQFASSRGLTAAGESTTAGEIGSQVDALLAACREVADGKLDDQFPIDVFQTGSGTSSNMNANEVIANRASELSAIRGQGSEVRDQRSEIRNQKSEIRNQKSEIRNQMNPPHPPQRSREPGREYERHLPLGDPRCPGGAAHPRPAPARVALLPARCSMRRPRAWYNIMKIGRTHLADAVPLTLGQELSGFARQLELSYQRAQRAMEVLLELPVGGTAVGTGISTHPKFASSVCSILAEDTGLKFREAANHFEANAGRDALVECHGELRDHRRFPLLHREQRSLAPLERSPVRFPRVDPPRPPAR